MSYRDKAAQGVLWTTVQSWGKRLASLLTFVVVARLLSPDEFGVVALALVFISLFTVVQESGFAQAIVQREALEDEHLDTAFWFSLAMGTGFMLALLAAAPALASVLDSPRLEGVLRCLSPMFVLSGLKSTPSAVLQRALRFKVLALRDTLSAVVGGVVGVVMALSDFGVYALVGQQLAQAGVAVATLWTATTWRPAARFSRRHLRDLYRFGVIVLGSNVLGVVNRQADNLLVGVFLGNVALGAYTVGYRMLTMLTEMFIGTVSRVTQPTLARLQTEPARMRNALYAATRMASFVAFPVFLGLSALAPEAVEVFFGDHWAAAVPVMRILGFIGALHAVMHLLGNALVAAGRPGTNLRVGIATTVLNLVGFATAIALGFGIAGVAAAYTLCAYVMAPVQLVVARRVLGISLRTFVRAALPAACASIVMWGAVVGTTGAAHDLAAPLRLGLGTLVGGAVYLAVILLVARDLPLEALDFARRARSPRAQRAGSAAAPAEALAVPPRAAPGADVG